MKAALHLHSTYSDGEFTLTELRDVLRRAGVSVAFMTDHAEALGPEALELYVAECVALSDATFRFIPGLEYECEQRMHILGYGVTVPAPSINPEEVIAHIERSAGVSVIAHPKPEHFDWIESFVVLPMGIETWNSKYHGRYAPRPDTFELLQRLQRRRPEMRAFYGQDLHWRRQFHGLFSEIDSDMNTSLQALEALRSGAFRGSKGALTLPSTGRLPPELIRRFTSVHARSALMRAVIGRARDIAKGIGVSVPAPIKNQLRRIF